MKKIHKEDRGKVVIYGGEYLTVAQIEFWLDNQRFIGVNEKNGMFVINNAVFTHNVEPKQIFIE